MKLSLKSISVGVALSSLTVTAFAADPIVGIWQMSEDGQPKAQIQISQTGTEYSGRIVAGQTQKAKEFVGKTVLMGLKSQGGGKYVGKAKDPRWGVLPAVTANVTVNNSQLSLSTIKGSETWTRVK